MRCMQKNKWNKAIKEGCLAMKQTYLLINEGILCNAIEFLSKVPPDGTHEVEIRPAKSKRKLSQNAALWAVAYPPIMESIGLRGEKEKEELHEFYCGEYWGWKQYEIMGKVKQRPVRTTTRNEDGKRDVVDKSVMYDFYSFIQQQAAGNGIFVPDPDAMYGINRG